MDNDLRAELRALWDEIMREISSLRRERRRQFLVLLLGAVVYLLTPIALRYMPTHRGRGR